MTNTTPVIVGWELLAEDEAVDAAIDEFGQDPTTSVAYCALASYGQLDGAEYRFWFDLFLKLEKSSHVGWA
ncbi:hypothetical protein [Mesorhizobium sp.]|uniref:hypothetical protein n=1 Tax=Mesorhizobium sp. TaxID=1871066 RepID=UPI0025F68F67|nr:hypothetical protein [Mesorhizobium sp.]